MKQIIEYLPIIIFTITYFYTRDIFFATLILFLISPFTYAYISIIKTDKRTDFPGKEKAEKIQSDWNKKYKSEIEYVVGDEWYGGNLSYHLESRPKWISINDKKAYELIIVSFEREPLLFPSRKVLSPRRGSIILGSVVCQRLIHRLAFRP